MTNNNVLVKLIKLKATADILGGEFFFATSEGKDPEHLENSNLLPDGMYIRLNGSDGSLAYISAFELNDIITNITNIVNLKANQSDITILQELIADKASNTDIGVIKSELENKTDKTNFDDLTKVVQNKVNKSELDDLTEVVQNKVNKSELDDLTKVVQNKVNKSVVDSLIELVNNKANLTEFNNIVNDIKSLQTTVSTITDSNIINILKAQIEELKSKLNNCLDINDLTLINNKIRQLTEKDEFITAKLEEIDTLLNSKASNVYVQNKVNEINNTINVLNSAINSKANKSDVLVKANKSDLDTLVSTVTKLNTKVTSLNKDLGDITSEFSQNINSKVNSTEYNTVISDINTQLNNKTNNSEFTNIINNITNRLTNIDEKHTNCSSSLSADIDELECEFDNTIRELRSIADSQNNKLSNQEKTINTIQNITTQNANQLKQTWVRVLSTNEYKNLNKLTDDITVYNPRYKYPNTVYFVVDFNIPKAIYIGDILIAKANQTGPAGFSYNFPITF